MLKSIYIRRTALKHQLDHSQTRMAAQGFNCAGIHFSISTYDL